MKAWYSKVRDTELIDGSVRADYVVTFETDNFELKRKVEKYLQGIMDDAEQTEPQTDCPKNCPQRDVCTRDATDCIWKKGENSSEKPNNCDECKWWFGYCHLEKCEFEPIDEPKSYTTWANTEPKQGTDCTQVDWKDQMWTEAVEDEPQTDCAWK